MKSESFLAEPDRAELPEITKLTQEERLSVSSEKGNGTSTEAGSLRQGSCSQVNARSESTGSGTLAQTTPQVLVPYYRVMHFADIYERWPPEYTSFEQSCSKEQLKLLVAESRREIYFISPSDRFVCSNHGIVIGLTGS